MKKNITSLQRIIQKLKSENVLNLKITIAKPNFDIEEQNQVKDVLKSGILVSGNKTIEFEKEFANYIGVENAVAVTNGTVALDIALKSLGVSGGDEIITSAFSFISSANCILYQKAKPIFADIDPKTFNLNPLDVAEKITPKTKAIIPVHLFGQPVDIDALREIAHDNKIALIEDAAQSHGAEYRDKKTGSIGTIGCFSFYATKNMTTGEGGMITTNDHKLANRMRLLINHGQTSKYHHEILGYNYRMTEICAALGLVQLKKLDWFNSRRIENADYLSKKLQKYSGLTPPYVMKNVKHVFHQYVIKVSDDYDLSRDELAKFLHKYGVGVSIHYPIPIYRQPLYQKLKYTENLCPNTEEVCKKVLSLPVHPLVNKEDLEYILGVFEDLPFRCEI